MLERIPSGWRQPAVTLLALVLGLAAGAAAVLWWEARPEPPPFRADEHAVELMLFDAVPPRPDSDAQTNEVSPLRVDGAVLLSGGVTSTVVQIGAPHHSLDVTAPALPVTVSPTARYQSVQLRMTVLDCASAVRWAPGDRPFTIRWRDEYGKAHTDRAGDFDRSTASSLTRYIDAVCESPLTR
ncbi:MAG: hypothetical protein ABWX84_01445 [Nocardioides sp.]